MSEFDINPMFKHCPQNEKDIFCLYWNENEPTLEFCQWCIKELTKKAKIINNVNKCQYCPLRSRPTCPEPCEEQQGLLKKPKESMMEKFVCMKCKQEFQMHYLSTEKCPNCNKQTLKLKEPNWKEHVKAEE